MGFRGKKINGNEFSITDVHYSHFNDDDSMRFVMIDVGSNDYIKCDDILRDLGYEKMNHFDDVIFMLIDRFGCHYGHYLKESDVYDFLFHCMLVPQIDLEKSITIGYVSSGDFIDYNKIEYEKMD